MKIYFTDFYPPTREGMAGQGEMYLVLPEFELYLYGARHFERPAFLGQQENLVHDNKSLYC